MFDCRELDRGSIAADDHEFFGRKTFHPLGESPCAHGADHDHEFVVLFWGDRILEGASEDFSHFAQTRSDRSCLKRIGIVAKNQIHQLQQR